jgi:hypothetical protein
MSKHTAGPWFADKLEDRAAFNIFPAGATHALLTVAGPAHDGAHPYAQAAEANARLIAAAPDLLEALLHAVDWLNAAGIAETMPVQQQARAAIAKATGSAA